METVRPNYQWTFGADGEARLSVLGSWKKELPSWRAWQRGVKAAVRRKPTSLYVDLSDLEAWDSAFVGYISMIVRQAGKNEIPLVGKDSWPKLLSRLLDIPVSREELSDEEKENPGSLVQKMTSALGSFTIEQMANTRKTLTFGGEILLTTPYTLRRIFGLRGLELLRAMRQCGTDAVPIVGLISFLTGMILAFQAALVLREYGADIFVANLIGLSMLREMGPLMTAIVLAGRTGAAYAAHLGNMKVTEEMDAFKVTGLSAVEFLVVPRVLAMVVMTPLLVIYANSLGIIGGAAVAAIELDVTWSGYFLQLREAVGPGDALTGIIKSIAFAIIIALTGCWRGLQCEGGSVAVGRATTSAVVTTIFLIIIADALFAVIFSILGW